MRQINLKQFHQEWEESNGAIRCLDVRTAEEFAEGHVKGASNISHDEVDGRSSEFKDAQRHSP